MLARLRVFIRQRLLSATREPTLQNLNEEPHIHHVSVFPDDRGSFAVPWVSELGPIRQPAQMNVSHSTQGVVRGMHWQARPRAIAKYVYCTNGKIFDQVVDLRKNHPTFGKTWSFELDQSRALYVPAHFAHGFQCLTEEATVVYLQSGSYSPEHERTINAKGYLWPTEIKEQSEKDREAPSLFAMVAGQGRGVADEELF